MDYENIMQILIEDLFQWDTKHQRAKGKGVLGTVISFGPADEEQGRGTLHSHWQIWIKEMNRDLRDLLFFKYKEDQYKTREERNKKRVEARCKFYNLINQLLQSKYELDLEVLHECKTIDNKSSQSKQSIGESIPRLISRNDSSEQSLESSIMDQSDLFDCNSSNTGVGSDPWSSNSTIASTKSGSSNSSSNCSESVSQDRSSNIASSESNNSVPDEIIFKPQQQKLESANDIFINGDLQNFRNARNRVLCSEIRGRIMKCKTCGQRISTDDVMNNAISHWRAKAIFDGSKVANVAYPFSSKRLDLWAINYSYDMKDGCLKNTDPFFGDRPIRDTLMHHVFDRHDPRHHPSCFKKGVECRHFRPEVALQQTKIYPGILGKEKIMISNRLVEGDELETPVWSVRTERPMGCQYLNTYNKPISEVFCCNTNIQIGDRSQVYYCTLYCGKSTQKDDAERENRLNVACSKRILRIQEEILLKKRSKDDTPVGFAEGLSRMLSAMNAAQSRNKISVCMQHRLVLNGGTRFKFSHGFGQLLVGQLESRMKGESIKVRIRYNTFKGKDVPWQDAACDHYLFRPETDEFENMCPYYMAMHYKSVHKTKKEVKETEDDSDNESEADFDDINEHERANGQRYTKKYAFRKDHPGYKFCHLAKLKKWVVPKVYTPKGYICRIKYLKLSGGELNEETAAYREAYAKAALLMFYPFRKLSDLKRKRSYWRKFFHELQKHRKNRETKFWSYGFSILQNIEDRQAMDDNKHKTPDFVIDNTKDQTPELTKSARTNYEEKVNNMKDILDFCTNKET